MANWKQKKRYETFSSFAAINGKLYANLKGLTVYQGEQVAWYMLAMGQDTDIHTVHFHAESFLYQVSWNTVEPHRGDSNDALRVIAEGNGKE